MAKQTFSSGQTLLASQMNSLQANDYNWTVSTQTANYTLVAADKGTREVMNMSSAGTVTVPNATFDAGDIVWVHSIGSGTITLTAGTGMTLNSSAGTAPTLAQWEGGVVYFTSASSSIFFRGGGTSYGVATGGSSSDITVGGQAYRLLTFTSTGTLTVTKAGLFDVLVIAGGAGGGANPNSDVFTGGGGGGGVLETQVTFSTNQTIVIGSGGAAYADGNASRVGAASWSSTSLVAVGGGAGCLNIPTAGYQFNLPQLGGSGGGGIGITNAPQYTGATGIQGNNGGNGVATLGQAGGGGGGGGAVGGNGSGTVGGNGGQGYDASAFRGEAAGTTRYSGGGGGGGASGGTGGAGGGGNRAAAGSINTGGGGGGNTATNNNTGAAGGSGIVLVRFKV